MAKVGHALGLLGLAMGLLAAGPVSAAEAEPLADVPAAWRFHVSQILDAERIADPLARCLAMPAPPRALWLDGQAAGQCRALLTTTPGPDAIAARLDAEGAATLDAEFQALLDAHYAGADARGLLDQALDKFARPDTHLLAIADAWVTANPDSAYAHAARGAARMAFAAGASASTPTTPANAPLMPVSAVQQVPPAELEARLDSAIADFVVAVKREPRMAYSYAAIARAAALTGKTKIFQWAIGSGLEQDPANFTLMSLLMDVSRPEHGGSLEQMDQVAELARGRQASNPLLGQLRALEIGYEAVQGQRNVAQQLPTLERAAQLGADREMLRLAADAAGQQGEWWKQFAYQSQLLRYWPDDGRVRDQRAALVAAHFGEAGDALARRDAPASVSMVGGASRHGG